MSRWPIIRHVRWLYGVWCVRRHYAMWAQLGMLPSNADRDYAVLDAIWRGDA